MKSALQIHHSTENWDFSTDNWELSDVEYISAPTSLRCDARWLGVVLCCIGATQRLPQGRMVSWFRQSANQALGFLFRNQTPSGSAAWRNTYRAHWDGTPRWGLYRVVNGVSTWIGEWLVETPYWEWRRFRLTWLNGETPEGEEALAVQLEQQESGGWRDCGTLFDTANQFKDSARNRVGLFIWTTDQLIDDTEIWGPA